MRKTTITTKISMREVASIRRLRLVFTVLASPYGNTLQERHGCDDGYRLDGASLWRQRRHDRCGRWLRHERYGDGNRDRLARDAGAQIA